MDDDPCKTAHIVANMMHDNSLHINSEGFDSLLLLKMFVCVQEARGFDENFMNELYDHLRTLAQENQDFANALEDAQIFEEQDIWEIP